ncbi:MAG: hypothetical protein MJ246_06330 [Clostridia bacterium]|nr:hypothetical protein [Clostridia bacterium]
MSHMTNKKRILRDKNRRNRSESGFNTGTRDMGYASNNDRKATHSERDLDDYYKGK